MYDAVRAFSAPGWSKTRFGMREDDSQERGVCFIERANDEAVGQNAADLVEKTLREKPNASIVFPTGNTPLRMYQALRRTPYSLWAQARLFHLDEYVPPAGYQGPIKYETYAEYMHRELFDCVDGQKFYMRHYLDRLDEYERLIKLDSGPDLVILGIGSNGHIAFNEPGSSPGAPSRIIELEEQTILDNFGETGKRGYPTQAGTLGLEVILGARHIILLALGERKRAIVEASFDPKTPPSEDCPASWLKTHPHVTVITNFRIGFH